MESLNWTCPHCQRAQTVVSERLSVETRSLNLAGTIVGALAIFTRAMACANVECKMPTIHIQVGGDAGGREWKIDRSKILFDKTIVPFGSSKPQPDFIPESLRNDYYEACLIRDLSPKASATLTRRCLQGMIRDFSGISKNRLIDEINDLRISVNNGTADRSITPETVDAIDHVRGIGNIGAHMEKDIDLILPVDPGEAQTLIELVEMLFDEWYGAREQRRRRLARIEAIAGEKRALKSALTQQRALPSPSTNETDTA